MSSPTIVLFGRSGSGKGTQARLLSEHFEKEGKKVIYIETGSKVRDFMEESNFTSRRVKEIITRGGLLPEFIPVWIWSNHLIRYVAGHDDVLILDGLSRRADEAPILDGALDFYGRERRFVFHLNVSREWSMKHLLARSRADDSREKINARLDWYEENTLPALRHFEQHKNYRFVEINGEQTVEKVHGDIMKEILSSTS